MEKLWGLVLTTSYYGSIVGILILIVKRIFRSRLSPKWGYLIWGGLIIKLVLPFGPSSEISIFNKVDNIRNIEYKQVSTGNSSENITDFKMDSEIRNNNVNSTTPIVNNLESDNSSLALEDNVLESKLNTTDINILPIIWITVAIGILLFPIGSYVLMKFKVRNSLDLDDEIVNILENSKDRMKVRRNIKIVINDYVNTPAITGILSPTILLPKSILELSSEKIEYVLLHELCHYKRKDILVNYITLVLKAIHWFNPIIWYCLSKISDIELATDEKVLSILNETEHNEYARSIISVVEKVSLKRYQPTILTMASDKDKVKDRIISIKKNKLLQSKKLIITTI